MSPSRAAALFSALGIAERDHAHYNPESGEVVCSGPATAAVSALLPSLLSEQAATKLGLRTQAAARRWAVETGGITVNGAAVYTDRDTQAKLTAAFTRANANPAFTLNWKTAGGFVTLTAAQVIALANAVFDHVQAAFDAEAAVLADIESGTITTTAEIDAAAWPSNS